MNSLMFLIFSTINQGKINPFDSIGLCLAQIINIQMHEDTLGLVLVVFLGVSMI